MLLLPEWPPPTLEEWLDAADKDTTPKWLLEPFIPADAAIWVTSPPKTGKTWFAFECVRALASGRQYGLFNPTIKEGVPCLIIEKEGTAKFTAERWRALEKAGGFAVPPNRVFFSHRSSIKLDVPSWRDKIREFILEKGVKFVLIDSLAKCIVGDENSSQDMGKVVDVFDVWRRAGASVMFVHHLHKPPKEGTEEDIDMAPRGSSSLAGYYDVHNALRRQRDDIQMTVRSRDGAEIYYRLAWDFSGGKASLNMERFDPEAPPPASLLSDCLNRVKVGSVYKLATLVDVWKIPESIARKVCAAFENDGIMSRQPGGWKREM